MDCLHSLVDFSDNIFNSKVKLIEHVENSKLCLVATGLLEEILTTPEEILTTPYSSSLNLP
jgi:hypothetical protein